MTENENTTDSDPTSTTDASDESPDTSRSGTPGTTGPTIDPEEDSSDREGEDRFDAG